VRGRKENTSTEEEKKKTQACHFHSQNQGMENLDLEEWGGLGSRDFGSENSPTPLLCQI
jgi:hypothetical protein